jgi:predicted nucleic acid-binding protein
VSAFVIDASVAIKWVVQETGTPAALALRKARLSAPDLLIPECANILWKKNKLGQLTREEALLAAQLLERSDIELAPMRAFLVRATTLAIELDHPAYDCIYAAMALERGCPFVTADLRFLRKAQQSPRKDVAGLVLDLQQASEQTSP